MEQYELIKINKEDLVNNPAPRIPVCLCLDTSGSMNTIDGGDGVVNGQIVEIDGKKYRASTTGVSRIDRLNEGIKHLFETIRNDDSARFSVEICMVKFDSKAECILPFANIERQVEIPELVASNDAQGNSFMGEGVNLALDLLESRKQEYKDSGVDYMQPWLILMTDGEANGSQIVQQQAIERIERMVGNKKIVVFPIAIGSEAGIDTLKQFSPERQPLKLQDMKYNEFFQFISNMMIAKSNSGDGEKVRILLSDIKGWAEI